MKRVSGNLDDTLQSVARYLNIDESKLQAYAREDQHTGWDFGAGAWACGSLHRPEGQTLYALIRYLKPERVLEIGALEGCSTTHMAQAIADNYGVGALISVDINPDARNGLPDNLRVHVTPVTEWGEVALRNQKTASLSIVYEDGDHNVIPTRDIWIEALRTVEPGGLIISHDPCSDSMGWCVVDGAKEALGHDDFLIVQVPPSDCGLLIYRKPIA